MSNIYSIPVTTAKGEATSLESYKGKALLIVNLASKCGYTPQYAGLQQLHEQYQDQGLAVLGFPCNDFGAQEPGTMGEIQEFCSLNYGVSFDLFEKVAILGENKHSLYTWLTEHAEPQGDVRWNFEKFLISRDGEVVGRFGSGVTPESDELVQAITQALA
ncbi:glutathione peroxidase [Paenibacillus sp. N1-5-1-14]|uniref:glutathione peroxidase n=1 Tax=Paenibacillus radicibacter TaxID=2972488 RepID=UPI00215910DE|nr:glutathione peroxidase [Paenibacillus radicibacter]MCR8641323.1 glutathione peroxidase [Paenibacillus radicibacter]